MGARVRRGEGWSVRYRSFPVPANSVLISCPPKKESNGDGFQTYSAN